MRIVSLTAAAAVLAGCVATNPNWGSGPIALSPTAELLFQQYLDQQAPVVFAVSTDGRASSYTYCKDFDCEPGETAALELCNKNRLRNGVTAPCKVFAQGSDIVWKGPVTRWRPSTKDGDFVAIRWDRYGPSVAFSRLTADPDGKRRFEVKSAAEKLNCTGVVDVAAQRWWVSCDDQTRAEGALDAAKSDGSHAGIGRDGSGNLFEIIVMPGNDVAATAGGREASGITSSPRTTSPSIPWHEPKTTISRSDTSSPHTTSRPIAVEWEGYTNLAAGRVDAATVQGHGTMVVTLPASGVRCDGEYQLAHAAPTPGTWSVKCSDGNSALGTMQAHGAGKGASGTGTDSKGRTVRFVVAPDT